MRLYGKAIVVGLAVVTVLLGTAVTAVAASTRSGSAETARHGVLLRSGLIGRPTDPGLAVAIRGVPAGAAPWTLKRGSTQVNAAGQFSLEVRGLLITGTGTSLDGTRGPVRSVIASLTCEGAMPTIVSTREVPLSPKGDAQVHERIALPTTCLAPIVLVQAGIPGVAMHPWIAATGF
jgi:hypothetical protein